MTKRRLLFAVVAAVLLPATVTFAQTAEQNQKPNIIRVSPFTALDVGVGFSLDYERLINEEGSIGLSFPLHLIMQNRQSFDYFDNQYFNTYVYFTPGLKVYPLGQRRVTYALGPNLLLAYGSGKDNPYYGWQMPQVMYDKTSFKPKP